MFRKNGIKIAALSVAGALVLGAAVYVTAALVTGNASAAPATNATVAAQPTASDQAQLRAAVLEMLRERMGLTGSQAEAFADQMIARMQQAYPNLNLQAMIERCNQFFDSGAAGSNNLGRGMMNWGRGMMNWGTQQATPPQATPPAAPQGSPQSRIGSMPCFR